MKGTTNTDDLSTEFEANSSIEVTFKLISKDGESYQVPLSVARLSKMVEDTILCVDDEDDEENIIREVHLPNVRSSCLEKIVQYCTYHVTVEKMLPIETPFPPNKKLHDIITQDWYRNFVNVERNMLLELVSAANYMDIKPLLDLTCLSVANDFFGKSADEIRDILNIPKLTEEEEATARRENRWLF